LNHEVARLGWAACVLLALAGPARAAGPRAALVIANSAYATLPALPVCAASANVVGAGLRRAGFEVTDRRDLTNGEMGAAIADFAAGPAHAPDSSAVIYVCGYAVDLAGRDFLLPASAVIERDGDAMTQGMLAKSVVDAMRRSGARAGLVLLDAVADPKSETALHLDSLAPAPPGPVGFAGAATKGAPPQGPTPFSAAISAGLAPASIELGGFLQTLAAQVGSAQPVSLGLPGGAVWLFGEPPPPPSPPVVAAPPAEVPAPPPPAALPDEDHMTEIDRRAVQSALQRLGYYSGRVDGRFGADTRAAIRRFQHEIGAEMTGRILPDQSGRLLANAH
jgi:hypothetical protein